MVTLYLYSKGVARCDETPTNWYLILIYWHRGKQCVFVDPRPPLLHEGQPRGTTEGDNERSRVNKTHCFPQVSVNDLLLYLVSRWRKTVSKEEQRVSFRTTNSVGFWTLHFSISAHAHIDGSINVWFWTAQSINILYWTARVTANVMG